MSVELIRTIAPDLADVSDASLDAFLELAAQRISPGVFGRVYAQAVAYLAAHLAVLSQRAAFAAGAGVVGGGPVAGVTTGGLSVSFGQAQVTAASSLGDESLKTTAYGLEFLALRSSRPKTKGFLVRP